jgi:Rnl2 family RNA ligase
MIFQRYNSIENSYQSWFVSRVLSNIDWYNDFIVQEKIHGANFSFYVSDNEFRIAKRTSFIEEWERFFNYQKIVEDNSVNINNLKKKIGKDIIVYWEIFWWSVQKDVFYCKEQQFCAFDIFVDWYFLPTDKAILLLDEFNILYPKILMRWTIDECFWFNINQNSILSNDIWEIDTGAINIMEWVVIRPNKTLFIGREDNLQRVIFKKKTALFSEKKAPDKIVNNPTQFAKYDCYITKQRLNNIFSKYWEITEKKELAKFALYLTKDVLEDFEKDNWFIDESVHKYLHVKCIKFILENAF